MRLRPHTFRHQLIIALLGFVLLAELLVAIAILHRTYEQRVNQAQDTLQVADRVLDELLALRADQLLSTVSILASDYGFKSAIATQDGPTQRTVLRNFGNRAQADLAMLAEPSGQLTTIVPRTQADASALPFTDVLERARRVGSATGMVMFDKRPYQFVMAPVNAPRLIAWIGMGFSIDASIARNLASVTGVNVEFIVREGEHELFRTGPQSRGNAPDLAHSDEAFLVSEHSLFDSGTARLDVALSLTRETVLSPYYDLASSLSFVFLITIAVSALVAMGLARRLSQPVRNLSEFAESIAAGHYHEPPSAQGIGELDVLTDALNDMQHAVRQRENRIRHQATHDALTGLLNRSAVRDLLYRRMNASARLTLVRIALHGFSRINGALGYRLGDEVLKTVAGRLKIACGTAHTLGRIEGNDFLVLIECEPGDTQVDELIARLRADVEQPVYLQSTSIQMRLEIGVVQVPEQAADIEAAWRRTVIARHGSGQQRCATFTYKTGMDEAHQRELAIIQGLAPGLERGELSLVYQPKMALADANVHQVEALARWLHPELGPIAPDEFIQLAERSGQIRLVTEWVVGQITRDLAQWREEGLDLGVAINLSADEIAQTALEQTLAPLFQAVGEAESITLEVTESALLREPENALQNLRALQARGARISVDDFGTGYSSLAQLKQLAPDELKIDKAFICDLADTPADQFIVDLIIDLGHKLGLEVVAEGIENASAWRYLSRKGVDLMQGYFLARPMPAGDVADWFADHQANHARWLDRAVDRKAGR
ncbi:sensory box/GGDEF family protein [Salinisphaera dokdonensis CL-ES53]|uniref:Sensory box/GGDEF family protein n=1 Tax=Salinisphaera dokdonensis CL-ES53 TaxID=1304272 RepID=A0ABV2B1S2_9GAMM